MIEEYLDDLVQKRYDSTFCLPGTFSSIEVRAVETSPDLHLARVYWSLPTDCLSEFSDSLQVKLIHHMQDVVFEERQAKRKIQRMVHTQLSYLRNPPKITLVWWNDELDDFDYDFDEEEEGEGEGKSKDDDEEDEDEEDHDDDDDHDDDEEEDERESHSSSKESVQ
jgi:hypothetical protein